MRKKINNIDKDEPVNIQGIGLFLVDVVGESHYQDNLKKICGEYKNYFQVDFADAKLIHENENPHDNQAVKVEIQNMCVGHLPHDYAVQYRQQLKKAGCAGSDAFCLATIRGGKDDRSGDIIQYGVWLDMGYTPPGGLDKYKPEDGYFKLISVIKCFKERNEYKTMLKACSSSLNILDSILENHKSFDVPPSIPAIEEAYMFLGLFEDIEEIDKLMSIIKKYQILSPFKKYINKIESIIAIKHKTLALINNNESFLQKNLKSNLAGEDSRMISRVLYYMEKLNMLSRKKEGNSYILFKINNEHIE